MDGMLRASTDVGLPIWLGKKLLHPGMLSLPSCLLCALPQQRGRESELQIARSGRGAMLGDLAARRRPHVLSAWN